MIKSDIDNSSELSLSFIALAFADLDKLLAVSQGSRFCFLHMYR